MRLEFHPLADIFQLMEGAAFDELVASVIANGLLEKIVLLDGKILDGRNRFNACIKAELFDEDVSPRSGLWFVDFESHFPPDVVDRGPLEFVLAKNVRRRHLSESQRAMIAARLANLGPGNPANLPGSVSQPSAAKSLMISERSLRLAKAVQSTGVPELVHAVDQNRVAVSVAAVAARLTPEAQQRVVVEIDRGHANVVRTSVKRFARTQREATLGAKQRALPDRKYGVILADPEWEFKPYSDETGLDRAAQNHYPTSPTSEIVVRRVAEIAADDCVLFLWATGPMLLDALEVMASWGFVYRAQRVWNKVRVGKQRGPGYWFTGEHELLLVGTRGSPPAPAPGTQRRSNFDAVVGEHSEKPDEVYEMIEAYFPTLPKIELNARKARKHWDSWGFEAPEEAA